MGGYGGCLCGGCDSCLRAQGWNDCPDCGEWYYGCQACGGALCACNEDSHDDECEAELREVE